MNRLFLLIALCCTVAAARSQTIFNSADTVINYNPSAPAGSAANPNLQFGNTIIKWVRTPKMSWNTNRYKCYLIGNIPFRLRYPDSYNPGVNDGKKYPIVLFFHGGGEANPDQHDNEFQLLNGGQTFEDKIKYGPQDAFVIFPQSRNVGWDNSYFAPMNVVIDSLIKNCKGDEDRVISMGLSIGGTASMDYASLYPQRASTIIASSPVFIKFYATTLAPAIHVPLWISNGGKDNNPDPVTIEYFSSNYTGIGANLAWSFYPNQAHVVWDYQWAEEPNFTDVWATAHKANPLVYFNNRFFCNGTAVSARLGITAGYAAYQWDKDGVIIPGAVSNEYTATALGTYRARFKRTASSDWSAWSLAPAVINNTCAPLTGTGTGLKGSYFNNVDFTGTAAVVRTDPAMNFIYDFNTSPISPIGVDHYSIRWTGKIQAQFTEPYTIYTKSDDGIRVWINGVPIIDNFTDHAVTENAATVQMIAGQKYDIKIEYYNRNGGGMATLKWSSPSTLKQMVPTKQLYPDGTGNPDLPLCTSNTLPANNAALTPTTSTTLGWNAVFNAASYDVYLWTGSTAPSTPTANVAVNSFTATGLTPGANYKWYVVPKNGTGAATGCAASSTTNFTINPLVPPCATNLNPGNGATVASQNTAALSWSKVPTATSYDVYIYTGNTAPTTATATVTDTFYTATGLAGSSIYSWYIVPKNITGPATGCDQFNITRFFTASVAPPACAAATSPVNGSTLTTQTSANLAWSNVATASSYDVYVWTGGLPPVTPIANVTTNAYAATGLTAGTNYQWYVVPKNAGGAATGCDPANRANFTTATPVIPIPACANLTTPINGTTLATPTTAALSWGKVANATTYDVYLYSGTVVPSTPIATLDSNVYTASGLLAATAYKWFVVPRNSSGAATGCDTSNRFSFTTASPVPNCATSSSPLNGATLSTQSTATLNWSTVATATSYDVYLWTGITAPTTATATVTTTSYNASGLLAATNYKWYVVPKNAAGAATGCDTSNRSNFTTAAAAPTCATSSSPLNGATLSTQTTATLSWSTVATATSYDVYLWTGVTAPTTATATVTTTSYNAGGLLAATNYKWFVVPKNAAGSATGCDTSNRSNFTTAAAAPACATNSLPLNGATLSTQTTATLSWSTVATATSYDVYLWTGTTAPTTATATVATTSYNVSGLLAATNYKWYVVPKNAAGAAAGCDTSNLSNFTTAVAVPVPVCATNAAPTNGSVISSQTAAALSWTTVAAATTYDVYIWAGAIPPVTPTASVAINAYNANGLVPGTNYQWYVVPKNASGPASGCDLSSRFTFTTASAASAPVCATNLNPTNGSTLGSQTSVTLNWSAVATASSYDVYLWNGNPATLTPVANVAATSFTANGLLPGTSYNWYIIPKNNAGPATGCDTSSKWTFTTAPSLPPLGCTSNTAPLNGASLNTTNNATLTWAAVSGATRYDVYLWTGATRPNLPVTSTTSNSFAATGLTASTTYNWFVVPRSLTDSATGCDTSSRSNFTTAPAVPACATNSAPLNGATLSTQTTTTISWSTVATATSYDVYLWTGATVPATAIATVATTSYNASGLLAATNYKWFVVPKNAAGSATGCDTSNRSNFTTAPAVPACATNSAPLNGATLSTQTTATLSWSNVATATSYDVYLWTGATVPTTAIATVTTTSYSANGLLAATNYKWFVTPKNAAGSATGCDTSNRSNFTTAPAVPACATNSAPLNGATLSSQTTATLSWSTVATATSYEVYLWTGTSVPTIATATVTTTSYNATGLLAATNYNWFVIPKNAAGSASGCSTTNKSSFTTASSAPVAGFGIGLQGVYYANAILNGTPVLTRTDTVINNDFVYVSPAPGLVPLEFYSVRWTGQVKPQYSETYTFYTVSDDGIRLWVNNVLLVDNWTNHGAIENSGSIALTGGQKYDIKVEYYQGTGFATSKLLWSSASTAKAIVPKSQLFPPGFVDPTVPSCATKLTPVNSSTVSSASSALLTWAATADATSYDVYLWSGSTIPSSPLANTTSTSFTASGLTASTRYLWYLVPKNAVGAATGCIADTTNFSTAIAAPACTNNLLPLNNALLTTANTANLSWTAVGNASSYNVYIWTGTTVPTSATATVTGNSYNATGLQAASVYNWFVAPVNAGGAATGCQSFASQFTTAAAPAPVCTSNLLPANNATVSAPSIAALSWNAALNASSYDVYIWSGTTVPTTPVANVTTLSYTATGLTASTQYSWYVVPKNAAGGATGCSGTAVTKFTTAAPSTGTGLQGQYYANATLSGNPVTTRIDSVINNDFVYVSPVPGLIPVENYSVRWTGQVKPLFSETYTFYTVSDDGIRLWVNNVLLVDNWTNHGATENSGTIALVGGQKYDVKIEYYQGTGFAASKFLWSSASTPKAIVPKSQLYPPGFVDPTIPGCAANSSPGNSSTIATASTATLIWNAVADATSYDVFIWTGTTPAVTPVANIAASGTTGTYTATGLLPSTSYTWYVVPKNALGAPSSCSANATSFTTAIPVPACTSNLLPANNSLLSTANSATLSWTLVSGVTSYDVFVWTGAVAPSAPVANVSTNAYTATGLLAATSYNWYVVPKNSTGGATGCSSNATVFVTAAAPVPSCAGNASPADGTTLATSTTATLTWNAAINASSYDVYLWTGITAPLTPTATVTGLSYNASGLSLATLYNWYVVPRNAAGPAIGCSSNKTSFTTAAEAAGTGLQADYYANATLTGNPVLTRVDPVINNDFVYVSPAPGFVPLEFYSVRWTGQVKAVFTETYTFYTVSDDGIRLWINNVLLVDNWTNHGATENSGTINLVAGQKYDIKIEYYQGSGFAASKLLWSSASTAKAVVPSVQLYPPAQAARVANIGEQPAVTSAAAQLAVTTTLSTGIYPTPLQRGQSANLRINASRSATANLRIMNSNGVCVSNQTIILRPGINSVSVNTSSYAQGLYILNITGAGTPVSTKLLVR
jgi:dienelactone hydrolase